MAGRKTPQAKDTAPTRKLIGFDPETWVALDMLRRDSMSSLQELADEAFADLLKKHGRPVTLRAALQASAQAVEEAETDRPQKPQAKPAKPLARARPRGGRRSGR